MGVGTKSSHRMEDKTPIIVASIVGLATVVTFAYLYWKRQNDEEANLPPITRDEIDEMLKEEKFVFVMSGKVYDVTEYGDHPGGMDSFEEVLNYDDAQQSFDDVGHSQMAKRET